MCINMHKQKIELILIFCLLAMSGCVRHDIAQYEEKMKTFDARESMALEVFKMPDTTSKASLLAEIKDRGLYYWEQNIDLVNEMQELNLPDSLHVQNKKMLTYCNLRIKSYNLIYKTISENT